MRVVRNIFRLSITNFIWTNDSELGKMDKITVICIWPLGKLDKEKPLNK